MKLQNQKNKPFEASNYSQLLIVADDFGMSAGVCLAITELAKNGYLNASSVMTTAPYFSRVKELAEIRKNSTVKPFQIGLHLDLTYGRSVFGFQNNRITDENGDFKQSFFGLFWRSFLQKKKLLRPLFYEVKAQFDRLEKEIGEVDYIDGHQHIHSIPIIFKIVSRIAKRSKVKRIRIINESLFSTYVFKGFFFAPKLQFIGLIKLLVLRFCFLFNQQKTSRYFFSILFSCRFSKMERKIMLNLMKKNQEVELMIHPGYSKIDISDSKNREFAHLTSKFRDLEREEAISLFIPRS